MNFAKQMLFSWLVLLGFIERCVNDVSAVDTYNTTTPTRVRKAAKYSHGRIQLFHIAEIRYEVPQLVRFDLGDYRVVLHVVFSQAKQKVEDRENDTGEQRPLRPPHKFHRKFFRTTGIKKLWTNRAANGGGTLDVGRSSRV